MSWLYSQALVVEYLGENCSDGEQFAQLSKTDMQLAYLQPDKMTAFSRLSRFGMMFAPLTENLGVELLMLFLADSHAKTLALQERGQELQVSEADYGEKWSGLLAKFDPVSYSLKIPQCSLFGEEQESLATLPRSGILQNGCVYPLPIAERHTSGTGSGLLPTPQATDYITKRTSASWKAKGGINFCLSNPEIQQMWATPTTMDKLPPKSAEALHKEATKARPGRIKPANLRDQVSNMQNWPTPTAHMAKETNAPSEVNRNQPSLTSIVGGQLNPMWVEWLMGWPLGWTDLQPLGMDKFQEWRQQHLIF